MEGFRRKRVAEPDSCKRSREKPCCPILVTLPQSCRQPHRRLGLVRTRDRDIHRRPYINGLWLEEGFNGADFSKSLPFTPLGMPSLFLPSERGKLNGKPQFEFPAMTTGMPATKPMQE